MKVRRGSSNAAPTTRERVTGCLVGGAVGDALGAPIEFLRLAEIRKRFGPAGLTDYAPAYGRLGAITDDTQMTLFTAEGLLRAICRGTLRGIGYPPVTVRKAYLRWLKTQGVSLRSDEFETAMDPESLGWLIGVQALHSRRGPGNTCLSALRAEELGTTKEPVNQSKGCGGVMRAAPAGIVAENLDTAFQWGCETAAITHGHPTGWLSAGALAVIVRAILDGKSVRGAVDVALPFLEAHPDGAETRRALEGAVTLAREGEPSPEKLQTLGEGWIAEEALAIGVYAALAARTFRDGVAPGRQPRRRQRQHRVDCRKHPRRGDGGKGDTREVAEGAGAPRRHRAGCRGPRDEIRGDRGMVEEVSGVLGESPR